MGLIPVIPVAELQAGKVVGALVVAGSKLEHRMYFRPGQHPVALRVRAQRETVLYHLSPEHAVPGAKVYRPAPPYSGRKGLPAVHVLND